MNKGVGTAVRKGILGELDGLSREKYRRLPVLYRAALLTEGLREKGNLARSKFYSQKLADELASDKLSMHELLRVYNKVRRNSLLPHDYSSSLVEKIAAKIRIAEYQEETNYDWAKRSLAEGIFPSERILALLSAPSGGVSMADLRKIGGDESLPESVRARAQYLIDFRKAAKEEIGKK